MKRIGLCLLAVLTVVFPGCSVGGGDGSSSAITVTGNDLPPAPKSGPSESQEVAIAKCLSSKGAVLYGASWCPYTQMQIESFEDGFQYLSYVECTEEGDICQKNGVTSYPTWIIGRTRIEGYKAPTEVGSAAGCSW